MVRVQNTVSCFLLCLNIILHEALAYTIKEQDKYVTEDNVYVNPRNEWGCKSNSDCSVATSSCVDGTCECHDGYIYNSNMTSCIKVATMYEDNCQETIQCSRFLLSGGICMNSTCVCAEGYYYRHGRCNAYSGLFGKCQKPDDCHVIGDFEATTCTNGTCKCSSGFYQREYRTCRREAQKVGDKCVIDNDCRRVDNAAHCNFENVCLLPNADVDIATNYLYNNEFPRSNYADESEISIGSKCTKDTDCKELGNAFCEPSGTCACKRAHFFLTDSGKCVAELGESCELKPKDPINIEYSECRNGRWNCELDRAASHDNRKCEKATKRYNAFCRTNVQCFVFGPDAICENKKCVCNGNSRFIESELFCWTKRGIGEACRGDVDCYVDGMESKLSCTNNLCACPEGTHPNTNSTSCVSASADIGMACEMDDDCAKEHTNCVKGICGCADTYYVSSNECISGINSICTTNGKCGPENSECIKDYCHCKEGYVTTSISSCIPVVHFGEPCDQDIQCTSQLPNTICSSEHNSTAQATANSTCTCMEGYHYNLNKCFKRKDLGMSCDTLGECYLDHGDGVVCKNGRCACDWDYIRVNDTVCKAVQRFDINSGNVRTGTLGLMSIGILLINFPI